MTPTAPPVSDSLACAASAVLNGEAGEREGGRRDGGRGKEAEQGPGQPLPGPLKVC